MISHLLSQIPYKAVPHSDIKMPHPPKRGDYEEPHLAHQHPDPF